MTETDTYDTIVLGGGMAGLPVALKSAHHGWEVALVEDDLLGGTCLNRGCIPTKTIIRSAEIAHLVDRAKEFGVTIEGEHQTDMETVVERQQTVVEGIRSGAYDNVERAENLDLIEGRGSFESVSEIAVNDRILSADRIIVNTGARPLKPPIDGLEEVPTLDSTSALEVTGVPDYLVVVGGGYVGVEYAQMYARFGADVTLFQRGERILPNEEPDVSHVVQDVFESEEITLHTNTSVEQLAEAGEGIEVTASRGNETLTVDASDVLIAAGRQPNSDGLNLNDVGIETDEKGFIEIDEQYETSAESVWAVGDVTGMPMFTHSARDDADLLYRHLTNDEEIDRTDRHVPHAIFTDPEVARVGLTEAEAREAGYEVGIGRTEYEEQGKPKALGETDGFVKIVTDTETDEILGAHIVGKHGAELIHELIIAMELGGTASDVANAIHIHPTLSEVVNSAAGGVHQPS
ncbi:dihydrolipoyl dehydrogenase [Natronococcus wangiae]|uniref:dihydrolipoyl dehydrogenase n=1 Tax=Natronococcus wangiae TaxID=3068275 RepID=UPI00273D5CC9|nr:dihydrolipoyl dehydrogenase [Natronococcus sp. AD5]